MNIRQKIALKVFEKSKSWGKEHVLPGGRDNPDKTFYVIRRSGSSIGLFSIFNTHLARIRYADENGMIPVVDMQHFKNSCLEEGREGVENAWEYFFEQPVSYGLDEAYKSRHIILSESGIPENAPNESIAFLNNENGVLDEWRRVCRKYVRIRREIQEQIDKEYKRLVTPEDKVLGVLARGTDYIKLKPSRHPIQPDKEQMIQKVKEVMETQKCTKVFLATEDKEIEAAFKETFKDAYITNGREFIDYQGGYLVQNASARKNDKYLRGVEYLTTIVMLSKCSCIVAGRTSGTVGACLLSEGWEYSYFFDLGCYE